jgi:hypothetical protein
MILRGYKLRTSTGEFEKLFGLEINFHKSELFCFGLAREQGQEFVELFGCKEGNLPFRPVFRNSNVYSYIVKCGLKFNRRAFSKET